MGVMSDVNSENLDEEIKVRVDKKLKDAFYKIASPYKKAADHQRQAIPASVAGEEFVLTAHTLNKWRSLLAYFDQNQAATIEQNAHRLPSVAK